MIPTKLYNALGKPLWRYFMQPEHYIQDRVVKVLVALGYLVLRVGRNGLPDLIAVHPEEENKVWYRGSDKKIPGFYFIAFDRATRMNPSVRSCGKGIGIKSGGKYRNLFLEIKVPGGQRSPRQVAIIRELSKYGISSFIDDDTQILPLLQNFLDKEPEIW